MAPPPPPPPSSDETAMPLLVTPPQKHKTPYFAYGARRPPANNKTAQSSPATSHASSCASPSQLLKTRSASEVLSPRLHGTRMDPYPRYSPRKRLSADYSDGTYSAESGADSPRSEKGGWRIHAAVQGPFLTGPLARDFAARLEELRSPRGKKADEPDFDQSGLLLFPVVPDFVAPAITPEVFQASIQPTAPAPQTQSQPQPEPDHSAVAPQTDACYYPSNTDQYYSQSAATDAVAPEVAWDATAQQQQEQYYYAEQQQQYSAEQQQQYSVEQQQQYSVEQQQQYYYNNGYDEQYNNASYTNNDYNYQQAYEQTYEQYPATPAEQPSAEPAHGFDVTAPQNADSFPPLPSHPVTSPEVQAPVPVSSEEMAPSNQVPEPVAAATTAVAPSSPARRPRAPSYAEIVTGAAHTTPAAPKSDAPKAAAKSSFATFDQLSDGIAESMSRILAKSNGNKTHAEVEFSCLIHRIQTQLKLMGRVSNSIHLKQMKTLHKLQKSEIEKLSIEASNMDLLARVKKYEQEQEELKTQLTEALEAKDVRLKEAVDQLSAKIDSLKNSTDSSTSTLSSEIDAIRKCSSPDDLEKRVEEIGQVLDYLIENQSESSSKSGTSPPVRRSSKFEARRQSVGSWKAIAMYAIVVWAASLCGVWVGVKYAGTVSPTPASPVMENTFVAPPVVADMMPVVESIPEVVEVGYREVVVDAELSAQLDVVETFDKPLHVEEEVVPSAELTVEEVAVEFKETVIEEVTTVEEVIEEVAAVEEVIEEVAAVEGVIEEVTALEAPVMDSEPGLVFTFEQVSRPSYSCFSCPSDHSTMASFFCEMLSEVISDNSIAFEQLATVEEAPVAETVVAEPVADVSDDVVVESVEATFVSENRNTIPVDVEVATIGVEEPTLEVPAELKVESAADVVAIPEVVEAVPIQRRSANVMSSPLVHALYTWCPSLFDMHTEGKEAASGPLSDLARALTSLSSQILSEHTVSTVEESIEEADATVIEVVEEVQEPAVEHVEELVVEVSSIAATPIEIEVEHEVADVEAVVEADVEEVAVVAPTEEAVEFEIVADEVADVDTETVAVSSNNRWETEQFLINVGVMSGTAEVVVPQAPAAAEPIEESIEMSVAEVLAEETQAVVVEEPYSVEEVVSPIVATEFVLEAPMEIAAVEADPSIEQIEGASLCPLERCPLVEDAALEGSKFANSTLVIAEPSFQIVADAAAANEEIKEMVGTSPVVDLKSLLLTSL